MKKSILLLCILVVAVLVLCGCTSTPPAEPATTEPTAAVTGTTEQPLSFAEKIAIIQKRTDENGPMTMAMHTTTYIELIENPTTGYLWNATVTPGLSIVNDTYIPPADPMPGAGGMHAWTVEAIAPGDQTFTAVYHRPWEGPSPDDVTYTMQFVVTG